MNGPTISGGNNGTTLTVGGLVQGAFVSTSGAMSGFINLNGPTDGPTVNAGNNTTSLTLGGTLQGGSVTAGSLTGCITIGGPINGPTVSAGNNGTVSTSTAPCRAAPSPPTARPPEPSRSTAR